MTYLNSDAYRAEYGDWRLACGFDPHAEVNVDHIHPESWGGDDSLFNFVLVEGVVNRYWSEYAALDKSHKRFEAQGGRSARLDECQVPHQNREPQGLPHSFRALSAPAGGGSARLAGASRVLTPSSSSTPAATCSSRRAWWREGDACTRARERQSEQSEQSEQSNRANRARDRARETERERERERERARDRGERESKRERARDRGERESERRTDSVKGTAKSGAQRANRQYVQAALAQPSKLSLGQAHLEEKQKKVQSLV